MSALVRGTASPLRERGPRRQFAGNRGVRASKFPLASSVVGGKTASALAAGCPIIFKTCTALHETSALVGKAAARAGRGVAAPIGDFCAFVGAGFEVGQTLVAELPFWLHRYNWHRPHGSLNSKLPISRLDLTLDNLLRFHS